ncbi:hypothetical protein I6F16_25720 [Bradyrhizobium sp. IC4060]|nr:hypothetical protein [Bradyrhizobium sp. IC4060]
MREEIDANLQQLAIEAHGGLDRFRQFSFLTARLHQFGILWNPKGKPDVLTHANTFLLLARNSLDISITRASESASRPCAPRPERRTSPEL